MASSSKSRKEQGGTGRSLVVQGGEIGLISKGCFQSYTNFSMDIAFAVTSPKEMPSLFGYVYRVKTSTESQRMTCFVSIDESQSVRTFVRTAAKNHTHLQSARIPDRVWSLYILNLAKEYQQSSDYVQKTLVCRVGKQPGSSTWVLSPTVQIDKHGKEVAKEKQKFFWHEPYIEELTKCKVIPACVSTPLSSSTLVELLKVTKKCLKNNFMSSFLTVAGAAVVLHYKSILDSVQDECPLLLCYSSTPGTGKSTSLRNVLSLMGVENTHVSGPDTHPAVIVNMASGTTIPLGIDDIRSSKRAETIAVQFFNGFAHNTCASGERKPQTSVIMTSNSPFCSSERHSQRVLHIPFFSPIRSVSPMELRKSEMMLKNVRKNASSSIGTLIELGDQLLSSKAQRFLEKELLPLVVEKLPTVHFRVQKCYALLLTAASLLCNQLPSDLVHFKHVLRFFTDDWSTIINQLHTPGGSGFTEFLTNLIYTLKQLKIYEVLQMVRPCCTHKKIECISLYMPMVREHCCLTTSTEKELKGVVKEMGGTVNGSGVFLSTTSTDSQIVKANGVNRRSVLFIPRESVNKEILDDLDSCVDKSAYSSSNSKASASTDSLPPKHPHQTSGSELSEGSDSGSNTSLHTVVNSSQDLFDDSDSGSSSPPSTPPRHSSPSDSDSGSPPQHMYSSPSTTPLRSPLSCTFTSNTSLPTVENSSQDLFDDSISSSIFPSSTPLQNNSPHNPSPSNSPHSSPPTSVVNSESCLVSLGIDSGAHICPVPIGAPPGSKESCPSQVCKMRRNCKSSPWVCCDVCDQWFHIRCVGLTKKQAEKLDFRCDFC